MSLDIATCIGCGCTDIRACQDRDDEPCYWIRLDRDKGAGVCSACDEFARVWDTLKDSNIRPDILTCSGHYFDFLQPDFNRIDINDIAHALSNLCRFTGHTNEFYSVAQHSVSVSLLVPQQHAMAGLLHDMAEAYLGDVSRPLKQLLPTYKAIERRLEADLFARFGLPAVLHPSVKQADLIMLATEQRDLMPDHNDEWAVIAHVTPLPRRIIPLPPALARAEFLARFHQIQRLQDARKRMGEAAVCN